jgi:energy-coupling factor transport system permease protein
MIYRRRASPLHAARAAAASAYCIVLASVALSVEHPVLLGVLLATVVAAAAGARVAGPVLRALAFGVPFAVLIALVNALVVRDGLTLIARLGTVPVLGTLDVTAEAAAYGGILGLRALVVIGCFALHSAAVDPDDLLRTARRLSFRSALTAALATRLIPVLARDARRLHDAQRCRAGTPASRAAVVRAVASGALDRAVDVAATLEVRGYGGAVRPRRRRRPWSRHDFAFAASAAVLATLALVAWLGDWERFSNHPLLEAPVDGRTVLLAVTLAVCALLPFVDRRGIEP